MNRFTSFAEARSGRALWATALAIAAGCGSRTELVPMEAEAVDDAGGGSSTSGPAICPDGTQWPCFGDGGSGGCSADLATDPSNCGACAVNCGAAACVDGVCTAELEELWSTPVAGERADVAWDGVRGMAADGDGGVFLGVNLATDELQPLSSVAHLDAQGEALWIVPMAQTSFGLASRGGPLFFTSNDFGTSSSLTRLDGGGATVWSTPPILGADSSQAFGAAATSEGDAFVGGNFYLDAGPLGSQAYVSRVATNGAVSWSFVASGTAMTESIAARPDGGATATIRYENNLSVGGIALPQASAPSLAVVALSAAGEPIWAVPLGASGDAVGNTPIAVDSGGHAVVARSLDGALTLAKLDPNGAVQWERVFGPGSVEAVALSIDFADNILVAGTFLGELEAGDALLVAEPSSTQAFVLKLDPLGEPLAGRTLPFAYAYPWNAAGNLPVFVATDPLNNVFVGTGACFANGSAVTKLTP